MDSPKALELERKLKDLSNQIVTDPEALKMFAAQWNNGFHDYSFGNILLIWAQKRDARLCAGYHTWLEHKRYVKKGEKGLMILAPMLRKVKEIDPETQIEEAHTVLSGFRVVTVFDVSQTDGEELTLGHSDKVRGQSEVSIDQLSHIFPYPVIIDQGIENGSTDGQSIRLCQRDNTASMIATYFHELAHAKLHFGKERPQDAQVRELEAEAVSHIVCSCYGIENDRSALYIGNWSGDKEKLNTSGQRIIKTAEEICRMIERSLTNG